MAFSSIPLYLDPPNWQHEQEGHQHHQQQRRFEVGNENTSQLSPVVLPPPTTGGGGSGDPAGLIRPGSMTERARLAKIAHPETALKCPRCESTNTKFCYFNNYNLSQPRHFCKTCRRYWTKGGALRNVPVGGGCRRNNKRGSSKRSTRLSSSSSSKSPIRSDQRSRNYPNIITSNTLLSHLPSPNTHLSFLNTPFHNNFNDFMNSTQNGLNIFGDQIQSHHNEGDGRFVVNDQLIRLQQMQQFSFFSSSLEQQQQQPSTNLYPIYSESEITHLENVKMEEINKNNNLGVTSNQIWTDISCYNTTNSTNSTSQLL